jgi:methyl-accepting chemotaxis protein
MTDNQGRPLVFRNGYLPRRELMTDISPVDIKVPKTRNLGGQGIQADSKNSEDAFGNISKIINRINDISNTIASVVEEQTATTNETGQNITEAVKETPKISDNITGVATAAKSTTQEATETQNSAQNMASISRELKGLVQMFKTS